MKILIIPIITLLYMLGGQIKNQIRRFGVPSFAIAYAFFKDSKDRKKAFFYMLLIPVLCMGYGTKSIYMRLFQKDWLVRIMYALTLSVPFLLYGKFFSPFLLIGAYSIRAGGFRVGKYDFLIEDLIRGVAISLCVVL